MSFSKRVENLAISLGGSAKRRDELSVVCDMLSLLSQPMRSTHILYKSNLSYRQMKRYLSSLKEMGLIAELKEPFHSYRITEKGRMFLKLLERDSTC